MVTEHDTSRRSRSPLGRIVSVLVIAVVGVVALGAVAWALRSTERDTFPIDEPFNRVEVDVSAGSVAVEASPDGAAALTAHTEAALFASADITYRVDGDRLVVTGTCQRGPWIIGWQRCSTDVVLRVPADVAVVAESSAGSVTATGLAGDTDVRSSAGGVRVVDHTGPLRAHSSAGRVVATGLASDDAHLTSNAGGVEVTAVEPPASLRASSNAGGVTVTLPDGETYNVDASTNAGSTSIEVPTDPGSPYRIEARSSAGSVTVRPGQ